MLNYYTQYKGNMPKVFDWVMCSDPQLDSHRFMDIIVAAIEQGAAWCTGAGWGAVLLPFLRIYNK